MVVFDFDGTFLQEYFLETVPPVLIFNAFMHSDCWLKLQFSPQNREVILLAPTYLYIGKVENNQQTDKRSECRTFSNTASLAKSSLWY